MNDRGSATVLLPVLTTAMISVVVTVMALGSLLAARARAQVGADAAALAAAAASFTAIPRAATPDTAAEEAARHNGGRLARCSCDTDPSLRSRVVEVEVVTTARPPLLPEIEVTAVARAEFRPGDLLRAATGTLP